jgi:hypothetical protein
MTKRNWLLIFIALALAGVYVFYFTDWFAPKIIHITSHNARATRAARPARSDNPGFLSRLARLANSAANDDWTTVPIIFKFGWPAKLTELKVVDLDEWQTNKNCLPLWHLVASSNSIPIQMFYYGDYLPGSGTRPDYYIRSMKPAVPGARAQPLQPNVKYRLFVTDGSAKGEHDFQATAKPAEPGP